jgi:hypothetical protein
VAEGELAEFQEFSFDPSRHQCARLAEATEGVPIDYTVIPPFWVENQQQPSLPVRAKP